MFCIWKKVAERSKEKKRGSTRLSTSLSKSHNINCRVATLCLSWLVCRITIKSKNKEFQGFYRAVSVVI